MRESDAMAEPLTVTTWNVNGARGVDIELVAAHARATGTDVLALQEVQRHQARALARALEARSLAWSFKHWPLITWPEGMALLGVTQEIGQVRTRAITARWRLVSSRRRIVQFSLVQVGEANTVRLINLHLSSNKTRGGDRQRELTGILEEPDDESGTAAIIAGDFNTERDTPPIKLLRSAGFTTGPNGPTKWRGTPSDRLPEREIDYVWGSEDLTVEHVIAPRFGDDGFARFATISDHLPVTATITR